MNFKKERSKIQDSSYTTQGSKFVDIQKTFLDRKWVWVPDTKMSFLPGFIVKEKGDVLEVDCDGNVREFRSTEVMRMNPPKFDMAEDLASLSHLNEPSVLYNLTKRYNNGYIYTYSGLFLLAINPYRNLNIYSQKHIKKYTMSKKSELDPHIFAVANEAYSLMISNRENQSVLITGESGAGKTENTKKVIEFLASVAGYKSEDISIDKKIIDSNPILEAFGNAKTVKNDNSSRFGKFIQIKFNSGNICGANIEKYLLEKSRITGQNSNERNYHIFYQLLFGADAALKQALFLDGNVGNYRFLKGGAHTIENVDDAESFRNLRVCMRALDISEETELFYYKIVAAVLHLGNIEFRMNKGQVEITNLETVEKVCKLLKISSSSFIKCLIHPEIKAGHEVVTQHRTVEQVYRIVEALAKILYDKMFDSIITNLNRSLGTTVSSNFIGVLDIAGFEIFKSNSFEQLCINYTNEKLQQFFNHHMFILEQEIYRQEDIEWNFIDFGLDLQPTIDLIESSNPIGIMAYLDEECVMPCASDRTFLDKLLKNIKSDKFKRINFKEGFRLQHYAGEVEYDVNDWIAKNKDPNFESLTSLINMSEDSSVSRLSFAESKNLKKGFFRTVSQKHKEQLISLMKTLSSTNPHFVRCIIPNLKKKGDEINNKLILEQLKCNGVLEGIRISRQGFPSRMKYSEFVERYRILSVEINEEMQVVVREDFNDILDNKEKTKRILEGIKVNPSQFRLGKTKIFFRQSVLAEIEDMRDGRISAIMREVQALAKAKMAKVKINIEEIRMESSRLLKKNAGLCVDLQKWKWWKLYLKIKPLLDVRKRDNEIKEYKGAVEKYKEIVEKEKSKALDLEKKMKEIVESRDSILKSLEGEKEYSLEKDELMKAIRKKNEDLEKECTESEKEVCRLNKEVSRLNKEVSGQKKKCLDLEKELGIYVGRVEELQGTLLEKERQENSENYKEREKEMKKREKEVNGLRKEINELNKKCQVLQEKCQDLQNEVEEKDRVSQEMTLRLEQSKKENTDRMKEVDKSRKENEDLQVEVERLESDCRRLQRQAEESEGRLKKIQGEKEMLILSNASLSKSLGVLKAQVQEQSEMTPPAQDTTLLDRIKGLEKKVKTLTEKNKHYEILNHQLAEEKEEIHRENLHLLQSKLDDIFEREAEFNTAKKNLQMENQRLLSENQRMSRELYEQRSQSESSDDSTSPTERLYTLLENEKKSRREVEQMVVEAESRLQALKEVEEKNHSLLVENESLRNELHKESCILTDYKRLSREVDILMEEVNALVEGINSKYFSILEDTRSRLKECLGEMESKEEEIKNLSQSLLETKSLVSTLEKKNSDLVSLNSIHAKRINGLLEEYDNTKIENISLEMEVQEKTQEIEKYKEEVQGRLQGEINSLKTQASKAKQLYHLSLDQERRKNEILSKETERLRQECLDLEKKVGDLLSLNLQERNTEVPHKPAILYVTDKQKLKDLERKSLIYQKELDSTKLTLKDISRDLEETRTLKESLLKENDALKSQALELRKTTNTQAVVLSQLQRELKDEKELISLLKPFSLTRRPKKK